MSVYATGYRNSHSCRAVANMMRWRRHAEVALALCLYCAMATYAESNVNVHVVFGNHLDIGKYLALMDQHGKATLQLLPLSVTADRAFNFQFGFDNIEPLIGYDNNVLNKYFHEYLPRAATVAKEMQLQSASGDRYIYTTHSFLISLFLDCPLGMDLNCPNATTRQTVLEAIQSGAITWHAHPHNAQYELYDASLLAFSFQLTHDLDARFGVKRKHTAILRDVPGLTRAAIPIMVANGIKAISVGVNAGSAPPGVPKYTPFIWRDEASKTELLAFWHPGGYGGMRGDLALDPKEECIQAPGLQHVLCTSWRNDNSGPPYDASEPLQIYDLLRHDWMPSSNSSHSSGSSSSGSNSAARVFASSFDAFVDEVLAVLPSLNLPVVTDEMGDTWVFGVQSDPLKTANFRAASRLRSACIASPTCDSEGPEFYNFSRLLLKVPEHTWGVDIKKTLHDFVDYKNTHLHACLPPHLRPTWAPGYAALQSGSNDGSSGSSAGFAKLDADSTDQQQLAGDSSIPSSSSIADSSKAISGEEVAGGQQAGFSISGLHGGLDGSLQAPCPNYGHCIKAWMRQAAYVDWAVQALPPSHWVAQAYAADVISRQQLANVSDSQLLDAGSAVLRWPEQLHATAGQQQQQYIHSTGAVSKQELQQQQQQPEQAREETEEQQQQTLPTGGRRGLLMWRHDIQRMMRPAVSWLPSRLGLSWPAQHHQQLSLQPHPQTEQLQQQHHQQQEPFHSGLEEQQQQQQQQRHQHEEQAANPSGCVSGRDEPPCGVASSAALQTRVVAVTGSATHTYWCGRWRFAVDESLGGITSLVKFYADGHSAGVDWAGGNTQQGGVLGQLVYSAYCEASYDDVWEHYAWHHPLPWWFPLDFGKVNSSYAWDHEEHVAARLVGIYEASSATGLQQLSLKYSLPQRLVREVGAPETLWTIIRCPGNQAAAASGPPDQSSDVSGADVHSGAVDADALHVSVVWQQKTPTRIPEAMWFRFSPAAAAVDHNTWRLHKIDSSVDPLKVMLNGSQSMHAVGDDGVSVRSANGEEMLQIKTYDTSLVSPGELTPLPNGIRPPNMQQGVHFNLANNAWGTNYIMWVPYSLNDRAMAFRFSIEAAKVPKS